MTTPRNTDPSALENAFAWLNAINEKHPPFDVTKWVKPSDRYSHLSIKELFKTDFEDLYKMPTTEELKSKQ